MASWALALGDLCIECRADAAQPGHDLCFACRKDHELEQQLTASVAARLTEKHEADAISQDERTVA